jgi:lipoprotein-anchoring transpeptidase ErfK/SrfK
MQFRSAILFGLGLGLALVSPAAAGVLPVFEFSMPAASPAPIIEIAAQKAEPSTVKKKKLSVKAKSRKSKPQLTARELAARAKAEQKKKLEAAARAKAEAKAKLAAKTRAEGIKKQAAAKAEQTRRLADRRLFEAERKIAKAKLAEQRKLAKVRAEETRRQAVARAAEDARRAEASRLMAMEIARTGNNGELRSESTEPVRSVGLFSGLFGGAIQKQSMLPETRALDAVLEQKQGNRKIQVRSEFEPQVVSFPGYRRDTIVIDTSARFLYLVESASRARRYAIAVGREGLEFRGSGKIGDKQEWPRWIPTLDMQKREPHKYAQYKDGMPGGPDNPLGARAMYVYQGGKDTHIRIHGTNQPQTIGTNSSNGCFRMINEHVMDLYRRVKVGAEVIVM